MNIIYFSKKLLTWLLCCFICFNILHGTISDLEVLKLGQDVIILGMDQHHFSDSQEIFQAALFLRMATNQHKPTFFFVENNIVIDQINQLPDLFSGDQATNKFVFWKQKLTNFLSATSQMPLEEYVKVIQAEILQHEPKNGNDLGLLDLFYNTYAPYNSGLQSIDHRCASALIGCFFLDYVGLLNDDLQRWESSADNLSDILEDTNRILQDLSQFPVIPLININDEQKHIHQLIQSLSSSIQSRELSLKFEAFEASHNHGWSNLLKAFSYFSNPNLFKTALETIQIDMGNNTPLNQIQIDTIQKIYNQSISLIISNTLKGQSECIREILGLQNVPKYKTVLSSFLKKRLFLAECINCAVLTSTVHIVELEALDKILQCIKTSQSPKKIIVLGGLVHMKELSEMLKIIGAQSIESSPNSKDFIMSMLVTEPENSLEAFEICKPINEQLIRISSLWVPNP